MKVTRLPRNSVKIVDYADEELLARYGIWNFMSNVMLYFNFGLLHYWLTYLRSEVPKESSYSSKALSDQGSLDSIALRGHRNMCKHKSKLSSKKTHLMFFHSQEVTHLGTLAAFPLTICAQRNAGISSVSAGWLWKRVMGKWSEYFRLRASKS